MSLALAARVAACEARISDQDEKMAKLLAMIEELQRQLARKR